MCACMPLKHLITYSNKPFNSDNNVTETLEENSHVNGNSHNCYPSQVLKGNFWKRNTP